MSQDIEQEENEFQNQDMESREKEDISLLQYHIM